MGAFSPNFAFLGSTRLMLGAAEAIYSAIAPILVADLFPSRVRTRMMAAYALAVPLGSALGFGLGGVLADGYGWRGGLMITGFGSAPLGVLAYSDDPAFADNLRAAGAWAVLDGRRIAALCGADQ